MNNSLQLAKEISDYLTIGMHHCTKEAQLEVSKIIEKFNPDEGEVPMECRIYLKNIEEKIQKTNWIWRGFVRREFIENMKYVWENHVDENGEIFYAWRKRS